MTEYILWNCAGFVGAFFLNGFIEWFAHRFVMHRPNRIIPYAYTTHTLEHHVVFGFDETYRAITPEMKKNHGGFCWKEYVMLPSLCFLLYGSIHVLTGKPILPGAMVSVVIGILMYDVLHYSFHVEKENWLQRTRFFRYLAEHHRLHHEDMTKNFNVFFFPIADFVMGTLRRSR